MKKKLIFSANIQLSLEKPSGIMKKVYAEAAVFEKEFDVYIWGFTENSIVYIHDRKMIEVAKFSSKLKRRGKYFSQITNFLMQNDVESLYIRFSSTDFYLLNLLKKAKSKNVTCILEIPTYPYAGEFKSKLKNRLIYALDVALRGNLKKYVDRFVIFTNEPKSIYGIECINTMNGVDFSSSKLVSPKDFSAEGIGIIAVGSMRPHHGFDRIIEGLGNYYQDCIEPRNIVLYVVGEGPELERYRCLVTEKGLEKRVLFCGHCIGEKLDELFDKSMLAVGALGFHRYGVSNTSALKNREAVARGLPVIYSENDVLLDESKYGFRVSSGEVPVEIPQVLEFLERVYTQPAVNQTIREETRALCDMQVVMQPILDYFIKKSQLK